MDLSESCFSPGLPVIMNTLAQCIVCLDLKCAVYLKWRGNITVHLWQFAADRPSSASSVRINPAEAFVCCRCEDLWRLNWSQAKPITVQTVQRDWMCLEFLEKTASYISTKLLTSSNPPHLQDMEKEHTKRLQSLKNSASTKVFLSSLSLHNSTL